MATTEHYKNGSGSQATTYDFTFPYLQQADVIVKVLESSTWVTKTKDTHYTLPTVTSIQFKTGQVPASGTKNIHISRNTSSEKLAATFYPGSAIRSTDLNDNYTQNLYVTQESETDAVNNKRAVDRLVGYTNDDGATWTVGGNNTNASTDPKGIGYAITTADTAKSTADSATATANTASTNASAAVTTANSASTSASSAVTTANTASTNASSAVTTANTASTNATTAVNTANAADTIADSAKLATDRLVGTTANNGSTWTVTGNNTNASTDPKGLGYAITTADSAVTTANSATTTANSAVTTANTASTNATNAVNTANTASTNASNAVTTANQAAADVAAAVLYTTVANKAALEALTPSEDGYYQVSDSTALANATWGIYTLSGIPGTYPNSELDGITTRLSYTHSSKTYAYVSYTVNDADARYVNIDTTTARMPTGTTAQRPGSAVAGMFRYNTTESEFEGYDGSAWGEIGAAIAILDGGNFDTGGSLVSTSTTYDGGTFT